MAEGQKRDYEARRGIDFAHEAYMKELGELRNRLNFSLSDNPPEGESASELSERIKALRASNIVEAAPA